MHIKNKIKQGQVCRGGWIQIGHPAIAEIMAGYNFDWIAIDEEHTSIDFNIGVQIFNALKGSNISPFVRVCQNDKIVIRRWMDAGAEGIIVPMVNTKEQAEKAVQAVKYPPIGERGFGFCRANGYGMNFDEYVSKSNEESVVIAQTEHIDAVRNINDILSVNGIDGAFIGPYDLSGSMGLVGQTGHSAVLDQIDIVLKACKKYGKIAGIHVVSLELELVTKFVNEGFNFIAMSVDTVMLQYSCEKMLNKK